MTPIDKVFMLSIDTKLDHDTMKRIYDSGHSRVPIYEEINVQVMTEDAEAKKLSPVLPLKSEKVKKIVGILLVKQVCRWRQAFITWIVTQPYFFSALCWTPKVHNASTISMIDLTFYSYSPRRYTNQVAPS